jgi:hypothetical protein
MERVVERHRQSDKALGVDWSLFRAGIRHSSVSSWSQAVADDLRGTGFGSVSESSTIMNGLIARIEAIYGDHRAQEWDVGSKVQRTLSVTIGDIPGASQLSGNNLMPCLHLEEYASNVDCSDGSTGHVHSAQSNQHQGS